MRIGTAYFADLVDRFGGVPYALASYNAGPAPVARWKAERPGIARDEFIDDIPYPETQNYVRKILGTAEDYRRVYGELGVTPLAGRARHRRDCHDRCRAVETGQAAAHVHAEKEESAPGRTGIARGRRFRIPFCSRAALQCGLTMARLKSGPTAA